MLNIIKNLQNKSSKRTNEGFTLIELMIVVVIIGILAAIAIPIFNNQQKEAIASTAKSDLKNAATVMTTESIKLGGKFPSTLPETITNSPGIKISLNGIEQGPLYTNPNLSTSNVANKWSWVETEKNFRINTGQVGFLVPRDSAKTEWTEKTLYYPRTGGSLNQAKDVIKQLCEKPNNITSNCLNTINQLNTQWAAAKQNGSVVIIQNNPTIGDDTFSVSIGSVPNTSPANSWPGVGNAPFIPHYVDTKTPTGTKWAAIPSLSDTNPSSWGAPTDPDIPTPQDKYCLNVSHKDIPEIKFFYDSSLGVIKEGTCS